MRILASGLGALEGPVTCQDGSLVVTSIDQGKLYRIKGDHPQVLAVTGGGPNGATEARDGSIFVSQNGGAAPARNEIPSAPGVQIIAPTGQIHHFGKQMLSPNDLCFGPDGFLYVTDPTRKPERDDGRIWRCDVNSLECTQILACDWYPNGIGFSEEREWIYVADSRHRRIVRLPISAPEQGLELVVEIDHGIPDGFAFDSNQNLVVACPNFGPEGADIQVYRDGKLMDVIAPAKSTLFTNLAISRDANIYICDAQSGDVYTDTWPYAGLPLHPFR